MIHRELLMNLQLEISKRVCDNALYKCILSIFYSGIIWSLSTGVAFFELP